MEIKEVHWEFYTSVLFIFYQISALERSRQYHEIWSFESWLSFSSAQGEGFRRDLWFYHTPENRQLIYLLR